MSDITRGGLVVLVTGLLLTGPVAVSAPAQPPGGPALSTLGLSFASAAVPTTTIPSTTIPPATPGVTYQTFDGISFRPDADNDGSSVYVVGGAISPAAYGWYSVHLTLPQDALITELAWYVKDNSASNFALFLYRFDQSGASGTALSSLATSGASTAIQTREDSPNVRVDNTDRTFVLYVLAPADAGLVLYGARVGYVDASPGAVLAAPVLAGSGQVGLPLTCTNAVWSRPPTAVSVQWRRDGAAIPGQSGPSYTPTDADLGHAIACTQTATMSGVDPVAATSNAMTVIPQLTGPTGPAGTAPVVAVFAPAGLTARAGGRLRVVYALSAPCRVSLRLARRTAVVTASASAGAGTNATRITLKRGGKALPAGVYSLRLRCNGSTLTTTRVTVTR